jgi:ElaB/YqjD/DUF883 family membrane-anchored ribosome-binding protein
MGERADEVRRDPLAGGDTDRDPLADPVGTTGGEARPVTGPDPALGGGIGGGAVIDEGDADRVEIERTRAEIERTRADMGETVDAIQQRLSPENLKEQAKDRVKEATVGKAQGVGSTIVETVRANPLPAALTGLGLGWLFMNARRESSEQTRYRGRVYAYDYEYPPTYGDRTTSTPSAGQAVERARDKVGETASQAQDKVGQVATQAQDQVSRLGDQAQYQTRRAGDEFQRVLRENPLTVGALAVGVGAAIGLAVPQTSREHEVMGEARDTFVEKAQEKAEEAQEKVQRVAEEAQSAAKEEAENQGLTNDQ